ncbi:hypothetical protein [Haladaptatus sp. DJG-WS-42]|uniref:hypothetical protein n=1 Tax=Haladaptatus sp. DJG-WS-42 TaxID=3120516 RepID=UPI0030CC5AEA
MQPVRAVASATLLILLTVTVVSGPLVGAVDLTPESQADDAPIGSGGAEVSVLSVPSDGVTLERGQYGSASFYLHAPDARVRVDAVSGQPMVVYKIRIPELGATFGTTRFLSADDVGTHTLSLGQKAFAPHRISQDSYDAELIVLVRTGNDEHELARQSVTVAVVR